MKASQIATQLPGLLWTRSTISRIGSYAIVNGCFHEFQQILAKEANARNPLFAQNLQRGER